MRMKQASRAQLVPAGKAALKFIRRYTSRAPLLCELDNFLRLLERLVLLEIKTYSRLVVTRVQTRLPAGYIHRVSCSCCVRTRNARLKSELEP
jgi:hypothetical protein